MQQYYLEHKEKFQKYMRQYYLKHQAHLCEESKLEHLSKKRREKYNRPLKNLVRQMLINYMIAYKIKTVLTLDSEKFDFSNKVPKTKVYVFENDKRVHDKMLKRKPNNVKLFFGDIGLYNKQDVDFIYLDFCSSYLTIQGTLKQLKNKIKKCKLFAITVCPRQHRSQFGDFHIDLIRKIQEITEVNWKLLYGECYKDQNHTPMITILFENPINI